MWNKWDINIIPSILHPKFRFRGSTMPKNEYNMGYEPMIQYIKRIQDCFPNFNNEIIDIKHLKDGSVQAKLEYTANYYGPGIMFNVEPNGNRIKYYGDAMFKFTKNDSNQDKYGGLILQEAIITSDITDLTQQLHFIKSNL